MAIPKLDLSELTFVVVDDEVSIINLISALLVSSGAKKVHKCKSAIEAQQIISDHNVKIDCIISDYGMEPVSGLELLQKIRVGTSPGVSRNIRFVMLTGHGEAEVVKTAMILDVDGYVIKPISQKGLISALERAFARKRVLKAGSGYADVILPEDVVGSASN
ncbi:MAG: response regulator [Rhodospirillaceae bacterium]